MENETEVVGRVLPSDRLPKRERDQLLGIFAKLHNLAILVDLWAAISGEGALGASLRTPAPSVWVSSP